MAIWEATTAIDSGRDGRDTLLFRHFGNHRQRRECGVAGTGEDGHKPGDQRRKEGDVFRVATQHAFRQAHQIVHAARHLHRGDSGNNRHDDFDDVKGNGARRDLKEQGQDKNAKATRKPNADTAKPGAQKDGQQDDDQFCTTNIVFTPCF